MFYGKLLPLLNNADFTYIHGWALFTVGLLPFFNSLLFLEVLLSMRILLINNEEVTEPYLDHNQALIDFGPCGSS